MKKFKVGISFFAMMVVCIILHKFLLLLNYLFALILHELAHIFVATRRGYKVKYINLSMFGLAVELDNELDDKDIFAINIAGPMFNLILCVLCLACYYVYPNSYQILTGFCICNLIISFFNLLPVYPLDGGKIFKSLFKTNKAYRSADLIVRLCLTLIFASLFIYSIFTQTNWFYLIFAIFFLLQKPTFKPAFGLFKSPKNRKFEKVVLLKVDKSITLFDLLKLINNKNYTIFYCSNATKKYFDEDTVVKLALNYPLQTVIAEI